VTIQQIRPGDARRLIELRSVFAEAFEEPDVYDPSLFGLQDAEAFLENPTVLVWVALSEQGAVIGGLHGYLLPSMTSSGCELYIYNLAVAQSQRRKGIGAALLQTVFESGARLGVLSIFVQVHEEDEAAHRLYRKFSVRSDERVTQYEFLDE